MLTRAAVAIIFALAAGFQVVRTAAVAEHDGNGRLAALTWPSHPDVLRSSAMRSLGEAAVAGKEPPAQAMADIAGLAIRRPLAEEPFLVQGAVALRGGDIERSRQLLLHGRGIQPRSPAARYLLADMDLRRGNLLPAMREMAVLGRFVPAAASSLAPALAEYAKTAGTGGGVATIVAAYPEIRPGLLFELAGNPSNVDLIRSLAKPGDRSEGARRWQSRLIAGLIERRDYDRAHALWRDFAGQGEGRGPLLYNPGFAESDAPPPFNWQFEESGGGVADPRDGTLNVLYYGRDDLALAEQTLVLPQGRYRLAFTASGKVASPRALSWTVNCLEGGPPLLELPLTATAQPAAVEGEFAVSQGCAAQKLALRATGEEFAQRSDARIGNLRLERL